MGRIDFIKCASEEFASDAILKQVDRITASAGFKNADRSQAFLKYIVNETLAGRSKNVKGYSIALDVFNRGEDFDSLNDTIVRVHAARLRERLADYYFTAGLADPIHISIPKGRYIPVFSKNGKALQTEFDQNLSPLKPDQIPYLPSIAVLPFSNLSAELDQEYFCDGITDEVISVLARFPDLKIASRNTMMRYKGIEITMPEIGRDLGVRFILDGSIQKLSDNIRIKVHLINASNSSIIWTASYDRVLSPENIFDIQDEIAASVATNIALPHGAIARFDLQGTSRKAPRHLQAYDAVLLAYQYWGNPDPKQHAIIRDALENAVSLDPSYAEAWAMLALIYSDEVRFKFNPRKSEPPPLARALGAARKGVMLSRHSALAWQQLSAVHFARKEFRLFEKAGDRALSLNPNYADGLAFYGLHLWQCGKRKRGLKLIKQGLGLNPHPPGWYYFGIALDHYQQGKYAEALDAASLCDMPQFYWQHLLLAAIRGRLGQNKDASIDVSRLKSLLPNFKRSRINDYCKGTFPDHLADDLIEGLKAAA